MHPIMELSASGLHMERISFLITDTSQCPLILGIPWLSHHNPHISWDKNEITVWSD